MSTLQQMADGQNNAHVVFNEVAETLEHSGVFGKNHPTTSGLTWGYVGGRWGGFSVAAGTFALTASSTNYNVVARATGVPTSSTTSTNWDNITDYARVYKLTTNATAVTATEDHRSGPGGVHGGASAPGGAGDMVLASVQTVTGAKTFGAPGAVGKLIVAGTTSGTTIIDAAAVAGTTTVTLPASSDTLVGRATTDTLTNKTLTAPVIATIASGAGTNTLPTATGTLLSTAAAVTVAQGGSGVASLTAYAPVFGGTTSTGAVQSGTEGTAGQVLTSNGAGVLPSFQALSAVSRVGMAFEKEFALSDLTTVITTGVTKGYWRPAFAATGVSARIALRVASSSGIPTVDMNKAGATMMSTKLTIDVSELTSVTAAVPVVMSTTTFAIDDLIEWDCDVAGTGAMGLVVTVTGLYA